MEKQSLVSLHVSLTNVTISVFLFNPFSQISFNIESPNIPTRIFFLVIIFNFTSLDSILFGELFALFFSACFFTFFSIWVFFHNDSRITGLQGNAEGISLTPHYHVHSLHRHLDIKPGDYCRELTSAHRKLPDSNREPLVSKRKSLATRNYPFRQVCFLQCLGGFSVDLVLISYRVFLLFVISLIY